MKRNYNSQNAKLKSTEVQLIHTLDICIKGILILFLVIAGTLMANAQVFNGQKDLNTQDAVDFLGSQGFTEISGLLLIRNSTDITDLSPLSSLTSVGGLVIEKNTTLTNLNGLQNITTVGGSQTQFGLRINENTNLTDLSGLSGIQTVLDGVFISRNPQLTSLNGLQIVNTDVLDIRENNNLINLNGLETVVTAKSLQLIQNPSLTDISSLSGIQVIPNDVLIMENTSLTTLGGLQFTSADRIIIQGNNSLLNVNGLQNLVSVSTILQILQNPQLTDLSALNTLSTANEIQITQNNALLAINGLTNLMAANFIRIENNTLLNNFCGLQPWAIANPTSSALSTPILNAYNPNLQEIITACDGAAPPTTLIDDAAFEQYLINAGIDVDPVPNGSVLTSAISGVLDIDVSSLGISNLIGIEDFTALQTLKANFNTISIIDLSSNVNLTSLELLDNNLSQIDLTNNTLLTSLRIDQNNLSTIDVSQNTALELLNLGFNSIGNLNISSNNSIRELFLADNDISTLDLANKAALEILVISGNQFASLDLSNKPELNLIIAIGNSISSVNFTNVPKLATILLQDNSLTTFDASVLPAINTLRLSNNALTNLNANNPSLIKLSADGNPQLSCIEVNNVQFAEQETLAGEWNKDSTASYSNNCDITTLQIQDPAFEAYLENIGAGDGIVGNMLVNLTAVLNVTSLQMSGGFNGVTIKNLQGISAFMSLETLDVSNNELLDLTLTANSNLVTLDASNNQISQISFSNPSALENINLNANNLSTINLNGLSGLEVLRLSENRFTSINFSGNPGVEVLDVSDNLLTSLDITVMAPILNSLNFSLNQIPSVNLSTATALSSLTGFESGLTSLDLKNLAFGQLTNMNVNLNQGLTCIEVSNVTSAEQAVTNGNWVVDAIPGIFKLDCAANPCTAVTITDPEFKNFLLNNTFEDISGNFISIAQSGEVCAELAATIVTLDLTIGLIDTFTLTTLAGIEAFTELKTLNLNQDFQVLSNVDVSQNLNLEVLVASSFKGSGFNLQLQNNAKLKELYIHNSGASLTISPQDNPLLEVLSIGGFNSNPFPQSNPILSAYPNLKEFNALETGGITSFGLSSASNLESINVSQSFGLTSIDLGGSPLLESIDLSLNSDLNSINLKNGTNNPTMQSVSIGLNGSNTCVQVDNETYTQNQINSGNWFITEATITENCNPTAAFEAEVELVTNRIGQNSVDEEDTEIFINITVPGSDAINLDFTSAIFATGVTATPDADFVAVPQGTQIQYSHVTDGISVYTINITDDLLFEATEDFIIRLNKPSDARVSYQGADINGDLLIPVTIIDNEQAFAVLSATDGQEGGDNVALTVTLEDLNGNPIINNTAEDITFDIALTDITTTEVLDYAPVGNASKITVPKGSATNTPFDVVVINDTNIENTETFRATVSNQSTIDVTLGSPTVVVSILDNDNPSPNIFEAEVEVVTNTLNVANVNENNIDVQLRMFIPNADADNLLVDFDIELLEVTATADADFSAIPANETFSYAYFNDGLTVYNIAILQDILLEGNEQFIIRISNPSDNRVRLKNADANGVLELAMTILDNETANAILTGKDGIEGGKGEFSVLLQDTNGNPIINNTGSDIDFDIQLSNGTATAPEDYIDFGPNTKITIGNFAAGGFVEVTLVDDALAEPQENLTATISNSSLGSITITQASATVNIATSDNTGGDRDGDSVLDTADNCPDTPNADQADLDNDGEGDVCDADRDGDGVLNADDTCPELAGVPANNGCPQLDSDGDGVLNDSDNCTSVPNADQADLDNDGIGDVCDDDRDGDGVLNGDDNCPDLAGVATNNGCPPSDSDGDGILDATDNCINTPNADQLDDDNDGIGNVCDSDIDGDGVPNTSDNCMSTPNAGQEDSDGDGIGDVCDTTSPETELTLNPEDIEVIAQAESCPDVANGSIVVLTFVDQEFTVTLSGPNLPSPVQGAMNGSTVYVRNDLAAGAYEVCITAAGFPDFEQCFVANVLNSENISVATQGIDLTAKTAAFEVQGSKAYKVQVNSKSYEYLFDSTDAKQLNVPIENGKNEVQITGSSDCQGIFKETVFFGKVTAYPNPVVDMLHLSGISPADTFEISIATLNGTVVRRRLMESSGGQLSLNLSELSSGLYVIRVSSTEHTSTIKIIKK